MRSQVYWILDKDHQPVEATMHEWGRFIEDIDNKRVAASDVDGSWVSTVFLGIDHNFGDGPPILFETMIFEGKHNGDQWRYFTYEEAVAGHTRVVQALQNGIDPNA